MHAYRVLSIAGLVLAASTTTRLAAAPKVAVKEEKPGLLARAKVAPDVAEASAQAKFPKATAVSAELEEEDGKLIYSFDFKTKGKSGIDEVNVDASTGAVLHVDHESPRAEAKEKAADMKKTGAKSR
jgi:uncharacterized membrane protein YkoI